MEYQTVYADRGNQTTDESRTANRLRRDRGGDASADQGRRTTVAHNEQDQAKFLNKRPDPGSVYYRA